MHIVRKPRHLTGVHKFAKGSEEFNRHLRTSFRPALKREAEVVPREVADWRTRPLAATREYTSASGHDVASVTSDDDNREGDAGSGSESTRAPTRPAFEDVVGDVPSENERYMTAANVCFGKYSRLIPHGYAMFQVVRRWHEFRTVRAGGNKKKDQHRQDAGYVNRFLAFCGFTGYNWEVITELKVTQHDDRLTEQFEAGTVARILQTILDFWEWARSNRYLGRGQYDRVRTYIAGCASSNRKDIAARDTERRVDEDEALPGPETFFQFQKSVYVTALRQTFRARPWLKMYDMCCVLLVLLSFYNGPRVSVFHNIQLKDIDRAQTEDDEHWTITVGKHKTGGHIGGRSRKAATVTVEKDLFNDLVLYRKTIGSVYRLQDGTASLFRSANRGSCTTHGINRMTKRAWQKAGLKPISLTTLRKLTTVTGREDPAMAADIANLLCHQVTTADKNYAVRMNRRQSVATYKKLKSAFEKRKTPATATATAATASVPSSSNASQLLLQETPKQEPSELCV